MGRRGVEEAIARSWDPGDTTSASSIMDCIARCRTELAKLKRSENMNSKTKIEKLKADLEKEIASQFPNFQRMRRLKQELSVSLLEEEKFWRQRSRVEWLKEGDRNTSFFHNAVRGRRLKNKVLMLRDVFGQENYPEGSKGNIAVEFYRDLFMSSKPMDMESLFVGFPVKGAFVAGRLITYNIIVAHEMVHGLRTNKKVGETSMAIKTDMSKAYDIVEWNFVEILLEKMGFARDWIRWVMACISSVSYAVLLNGQSHSFIRPERGIRQGDPLSPFLFILCTEALVNVLNQSETQGKVHGIKLSSSCPAVHHLLFADDSLLMCDATVCENEEIKSYLKLYGDASGQVINTSKSSIIFGSGISQQQKMEIQEVLDIMKEGGEGTYLGLPECFKGSKKDLLNFIKERLEGRLQGWYTKTLSMGAKEVLIKSVALALPIYAMSVFQLPKELVVRLTSVIVEYWWSSGDKKRKIPWVAWQKLCKPKDQGCMAFHDIGRFNQALLGKQAWRIWSRPNSLVARVLKGQYFSKKSFLECGSDTRPSFAWRSILHGRELLKQGLYRAIGNGVHSNVWVENWIINGIPRPPMYREDREVNLALKVADLLEVSTGRWNRELVYETFAPSDADRIMLLKPLMNREDSIIWGFTKNGIYITRSGYHLTETLVALQAPDNCVIPPVEKKLWSNIWKIKAPSKLKHFFWRSLSGALAVKERLQTRGIQIDATCQSCGAGTESIFHVLFLCNKAQQMWELANIPIPPAGFSANSVFLNIYLLVGVMNNSRLEMSITRAVPWVLWQIWKARNSLAFKNTSLSPRQAVRTAFEEAELWFLANSPQRDSEPTPTVKTWIKPPIGTLKCNVGSSWVCAQRNCGAAWILRDPQGRTVAHSRRSYSAINSGKEAHITALLWAVESMHNMRQNNIIFETSTEDTREIMSSSSVSPSLHYLTSQITALLHKFEYWSLDHAADERNVAANMIAGSVTTGHQYQSYIASQGPAWLYSLLSREARG
ncbi:PREDICTED: uncharacterized protein LOC106314175 [Brassica oleracea var. oleracea]|uniref:uncharacterized protein LOC106314175 n=1 Tax=Brassica oleracea var. oleracea TaxID=109376 RepID=UPI0006A6BC7B|nr:PREDICTED: uncharacterized protein LOC106314175 [Brassica oleracea var. oleracea]